MIIERKKGNYSFHCDWLSFSVVIPHADVELNKVDGYRCELFDGNNIYKHRAIVTDVNGQKWLTMLWKPYSCVIKDNIMSVQISNECLYYYQEQEAFDLLQKFVPCVFNAFSRIDLALDFVPTVSQLDTIKKLYNGKYYVQKKQCGTSWWYADESKKTGKIATFPTCLNFGSPTSEIKVKIYNKSREQGLLGGELEKQIEVAPKPYIIKKWKQAELDIKHVWRVEFSLSGAGQLKFDSQLITWEMYKNIYYLFDVFSELVKTRLVIRKNEGKRDEKHNRDKVIKFLDLSENSVSVKWKESVSEIESKESIVLLNRLLRTLEEPLSLSNEIVFDSIVSSIDNVVKSCGLGAYFARTKGYTNVDAYANSLRKIVGAMTVRTALRPSTSWE